MSLRIRANGDIVCAAKTRRRHGDTYIHDGLHYQLSLIGAIEPDPDEGVSGRWHWLINTPYWIRGDADVDEKVTAIVEAARCVTLSCEHEIPDDEALEEHAQVALGLVRSGLAALDGLGEK